MFGNRKRIFSTLIMVTIVGCTQPDQKTALRRTDKWRPTPQPTPTNVREDKAPSILPDTYIAAARMFESRGMSEKAMAQYRKAIAVNRSSVSAYHRLGLLLSASGQRDEAIDMLRRAASLAPDNAVIRNNLGFELVMAQRWEEAEPELTAAINIDPDFPRANVNLGIVRSRLGQFDEALACFRRVLPETDAQYNLGLMYRGQRRYQEAADAFHRVLDLDPQFVAASTQLEQLASRNEIKPVVRPIARPTMTPETTPTLAQRSMPSINEIEPVFVRTGAALLYEEEDGLAGDTTEPQAGRTAATKPLPLARTVGTRQVTDRPEDRWDELDSIIEIAENEIRCLQEREDGPQGAAPQPEATYLAHKTASEATDAEIEPVAQIIQASGVSPVSDLADDEPCEDDPLTVDAPIEALPTIVAKPSTAKRPGLTQAEVLETFEEFIEPEGESIIESFADFEWPTSPADPVIEAPVVTEPIFTAYDLEYGETLLVGADNPLDAWELIEQLEAELDVVRNEINCLDDPYEETPSETFASGTPQREIPIEALGPIPAFGSPREALIGPPAELAQPRAAVLGILQPTPVPPQPTARLVSDKKAKTPAAKPGERSAKEQIDAIKPMATPASPARSGKPNRGDRGASSTSPASGRRGTPEEVNDQVDELLAIVMGEITGWEPTGSDDAFPRSTTDGDPMHWLFRMFEEDAECQDGTVKSETRTTQANRPGRMRGTYGHELPPLPD